MFTAVAIAFRTAATAAALTGAQGKFKWRRPARNIGIHVPNLSVWLNVGGIKSVPNSGCIANHIVILDDVVKGYLQGLPCFSDGGIVVPGRNLRKSTGEKAGKDYCREEFPKEIMLKRWSIWSCFQFRRLLI